MLEKFPLLSYLPLIIWGAMVFGFSIYWAINLVRGSGMEWADIQPIIDRLVYVGLVAGFACFSAFGFAWGRSVFWFLLWLVGVGLELYGFVSLVFQRRHKLA